MGKHIRFDWAIKRLLRHKANFDILEGFMSVVLKQDIKIKNLLESESNQLGETDKFNRVDILVENTAGELMLVEIQNTTELDYFQRMLYGVSKLVTEYLHLGEPYGKIKKIISLNIVYFSLGQGEDYVYEGTTKFVGLNKGDILNPSLKQSKDFNVRQVAEIFPRYWLFRVNQFNDIAKTPLDQWIYFLKNSEIPTSFKARGLQEARERLRVHELSGDEKIAYDIFVKHQRIRLAERYAAEVIGEERGLQRGFERGLKKGIEEGLQEGKKRGLEEGKKRGLEEGKKQGEYQAKLAIAQNLKKSGVAASIIAQTTGLSENEIAKL